MKIADLVHPGWSRFLGEWERHWTGSKTTTTIPQ